jgi:hypothetical protein
VSTNKLPLKELGRDTGEPGTFLFNTLYNIAVTFLKYGKHTALFGCWLFGGDDMASSKVHMESDAWTTHWRPMLLVQSKTFVVPVADFCGWILSPKGIIRSPYNIFIKLAIATSRGTMAQVAASYAVEISWTYRKGQYLLEVLDELELAYLSTIMHDFHSYLPVLSLVLFGKRHDNLLERLQAKVEQITAWTHYSGRKGHLRALQQAINRALSSYGSDSSLSTVSKGEFDDLRPSHDLSSPHTHSNKILMSSLNAAINATGTAISTVGDGSSIQNRPVPGGSSGPIPPEFFTKSWDSSSWPFIISATFGVPKATTYQNGETWTKVHTWDFASDTNIAAYIKYSSIAAIGSVRVNFTVDQNVAGSGYWIYCGLQKASETAPSTASAMLLLPGARRELVHPTHPDTCARPFEAEYPVGQWGVNALIKGTMLVGGAPRLVCIPSITFKRLSSGTYDSNSKAYKLVDDAFLVHYTIYVTVFRN